MAIEAEEKTRPGYKWVATSNGGYWVKQTGQRHTHKLPFFCPYEKCGKITGTIDDESMLKYGVCLTCVTMYIEERQKPLIDVAYYVNRLKERGY